MQVKRSEQNFVTMHHNLENELHGAEAKFEAVMSFEGSKVAPGERDEVIRELGEEKRCLCQLRAVNVELVTARDEFQQRMYEAVGARAALEPRLDEAQRSAAEALAEVAAGAMTEASLTTRLGEETDKVAQLHNELAEEHQCSQRLRAENTGLERDVVDLARMLAELKD